MRGKVLFLVAEMAPTGIMDKPRAITLRQCDR